MAIYKSKFSGREIDNTILGAMMIPEITTNDSYDIIVKNYNVIPYREDAELDIYINGNHHSSLPLRNYNPFGIMRDEWYFSAYTKSGYNVIQMRCTADIQGNVVTSLFSNAVLVFK